MIRSLSRPQVSDDNPFSEAAFKTLRHFREYPDRFVSLEDARSYFRGFFPAYNLEHRHSGVAMLTPATVHNGDADAVLRARHAAMLVAYSPISRSPNVSSTVNPFVRRCLAKFGSIARHRTKQQRSYSQSF
jgi:hypothetical protein